MKSQILKCLLLMLLTGILTYFITCFYCKKKGDGNTDGTRDLETICMNYDTITPPTLTGKMVRSMVVQYDSIQLSNIQNAPTNAIPQDAKAIWFDLETLKEFLYHIEHSAAENHAESQGKKLGVRIYYSAYPKNDVMRDLAQHQTDPNFSFNPAYEKLHTLVMIPTISGTDGEHYDFNPLDVNSYIGFTNLVKNNPNFNFDTNTYQTLTLGTCRESVEVSSPQTPSPPETNARNHGSLYPPNNVNGLFFN